MPSRTSWTRSLAALQLGGAVLASGPGDVRDTAGRHHVGESQRFCMWKSSRAVMNAAGGDRPATSPEGRSNRALVYDTVTILATTNRRKHGHTAPTPLLMFVIL